MAQRAVGTKIQINTNYIAELTSIGGLKLSADTIDITSLDSTGGYRQFIGGFKDGGEIALKGWFNPGDLGQNAVYTAFINGTTDSYTILFPSALGASWVFSGVITAFETSADLQDAVTFDATIKVSGQPTLATTASANLTALAATGTAGSLSPAFAAGTYSYSYSFTGTSLTVTPTLSGATFNIFVDGVLVQSGLASGTASSTITFSAVGTKMIDIIYNETGKAQKMYSIVANRTA